jgi:hypothetical protein
MKRDADKKAIGIWLECYNSLNGTTFRVESYPDEQQRNVQSIDALCRASDGETLAVEHTRIEAFPGEKADNPRFLEVVGRFEKEPSLAELGVHTSVSIAVGAIPTGISWTTLGDDLGTFFEQNIPGRGLGSYDLMFTQGSVSIPVRIEKRTYLPGRPGVFLIARHWPGKINDSSVRKAFEDKLPKLRAASANRKILLVEQDSIAGAAYSDIERYVEANGWPLWMPDEVWQLWTAVLETEKYMHVAQLYPDMNGRRADWSDSKITSQYP